MNDIVENKSKSNSEKSPVGVVSNISGGAGKASADGNDFFVQAQTISLPKGGGAVKSIDEKFSVNAVTGTSTINIPLPNSASRNNFSPALSLSYNSGSGNSEFGIGWSVQVPSVSRKTDKGIPKYYDDVESDVFLIAGSEDMVPQLQQNGDNWVQVPVPDVTENGITYTIKLYRPRIEGTFTRIEKWTNTNSREIHWRAISRDNILSVYGDSDSTCIADPDDPKKVFRWLLSYSCDDKGNLSVYNYKKEDFAGVETRIFEKNKLHHCTNTYLKQVFYGNKIPFYRGSLLPAETDFMFNLVFDYGEHDTNGMGFYTDIDHSIPADVNIVKNTWAYRKDAFSQFRPGFDLRTYRRCARVMLFHCFDELRPNAAPYLVHSMELVYNEQLALVQANDAIDGFSYLVQLIHKRHQLNANGSEYDSRTLPSFNFTYQQLEWNTEIKSITTENLPYAPSPAEGGAHQWMDLYSEGISGLLTEQGSNWFYKYNLGNGIFSAPELVATKPSFTGLADGKISIRDISGNGKKSAVGYSGAQQGFFGLAEDKTWEPFKEFPQLVNLDFKDPNLKWIDLDGDGLPDLMLSENDAFWWYPAKGELGFDAGNHVQKANDEEKGPAIVFADGEQSIYLADMTGHGLTDIVRVRNGEVCYWANKGYGRFSAKVTMEDSPVFDNQESFNPAFLRLADIDGSGTTDLVYLGKKNCRIWANNNGNSWREKLLIIDPFPEVNNITDVSVFDLLGTGTACLVYTSPILAYNEGCIKYIDLMDSKKPHLLSSYQNNTGKSVTLTYQPSTYFYLQDKLAGNQWITRLPFPVNVLAQTQTTDLVSKAVFVSQYTYHHGYYDGIEREFRGFGRVDQLDTETYTNFARNGASNVVDETLHQPPVLTKSWFHTGAFLSQDNILLQYSHEYHQPLDFNEHHLPDAQINLPAGLSINNLSSPEYAEALRACKSRLLRKEIYAMDGTQLQQFPYSTSEENCYISLLQPRSGNPYAVYIANTSETITHQYERVTADPRITHQFNLDIDDYNNVLLSASVVYPRMVNNPGLSAALQLEIQQLPAAVKTAQAALNIKLTSNSFTNAVIAGSDYRLPSTSSTQEWQLTGCNPLATFFTFIEIYNGAMNAAPLQYTDIPGSALSKRLLSNKRILYAADDAATPLPLDTQASKGIKYESYKLAYNGALLSGIYSGKVNDAMLTSGQYRLGTAMQPSFPVTDNAGEWWIPSGRQGYPANPASHFFLPDAQINPYGKATLSPYETKYHLYIAFVQDAVGNQQSITTYDFRLLQPQVTLDANLNITEIRSDIIGLVVGVAQRGKGTGYDDFDGFINDLDEATLTAFFNDPVSNGAALLQHASSRVVYNMHSLPLTAATITRERHYADVVQNGLPDKLQYSFEYSGGTGQVLMKKIEATPGIANYIDDNGLLQTADTTPFVRWIGNGRTVLNNKGNPVKQYQPYFSTTHAYEDDSRLVENGPTNILFYDAMGKNTLTQLPNETFTKTITSAWKIIAYDANDTVTDSAWYNKRINRLIDAELTAEGKDPAKEQQAAAKAAKHYGTPAISHLDSLGRAMYKVAWNKDLLANDVFQETAINLDIKNNTTSVINELGAMVMQFKYDIAGNAVWQLSDESGSRITFFDALNSPLNQWDSRQQVFAFTYDDLQRPLTLTVTGGDGPTPLNHLVTKTIYGEGQAGDKTHNLRTKLFQQYDQSGIITHPDYDINGNPTGIKRQYCSDYNKNIDWAGAVKLDDDIYESSMAYDALKRIITVVAPHVDGKPQSVYYAGYNESGLMGSVQVSIRNGAVTPYVTSVNYNEQGSRADISFGNNTKTSYTYDSQTKKLIHLRTTRPMGINGYAGSLFNDATVLQDLAYTMDPMGNTTAINDAALKSIFFDGQQADAANDYEYDALYQLISSTGRKHAGQTDLPSQQPNFNYHNYPFNNSGTVDPNDLNAFRNYQELYSYDKAGNMLQQQHIAKSSNWTRAFDYTNANNQLTKTTVGAISSSYLYDAHGSMKAMEHLQSMVWDFSDSLQMVDLGGGGKAWYTYDNEGKRTRKVIERLDGSKNERLYIGGFEIYREKDNTGQVTLERETLQVMDDKKCIAMADTETTAGVAAQPLVRYQYDNHLGSSSLELDADAKIITYEEYFAFGTSSFCSTDSSREIPEKRYRYCSKERDDETGLGYHGARYYAPWLCRWIAADKLKQKEIGNRYKYVSNNPVNFLDANGAFEEPTHGALTYRLALAAGFTEEEAAEVALSTAGMDHAKETRPGDGVLEMIAQIVVGNTQKYHFPSNEKALGDVDHDIAKGTDLKLSEFGRHLHSLEDVGFADAKGPHTRTDEHFLSESTGLIGTLGLMGGAAILADGIDKGSKGLKALAIAIFIVAAIFIAFAIRADGVGHPSYITEKQHISYSFSHMADRASEDPIANTKELKLIYNKLREAAMAKHGKNVVHNDDAATAAIQRDIKADSEESINIFLNEDLHDAKGGDAKSYAAWVKKQGEEGTKYFDDVPQWKRVEIDASVTGWGKDYHYQE